MKLANRMNNVAPYLFASMNVLKEKLRQEGVDIIDMSVGDPDLPTPDHVIEALIRGARNPANHRYPPYEGTAGFKAAVSQYYGMRFGVDLDPKTEVMTLIGSKEGISHLIWGLVDGEHSAIIPDPAYPVYDTQVGLAGGVAYKMPLKRENGYLPRLDEVPRDVAKRASLLILNYPNNPTGAVADLGFFEEVVRFCKEYDIVFCHDAAYVDIGFDGYKPPSALQVSKEMVVESYSLSKPFNMTGWRIAAMVGDAEVIKRALGIVKTNTDSGQFNAVQEAGEAALTHDPLKHIAHNTAAYAERRDVMVSALRDAGLEVAAPKGSFYLWVPVPEGETSESFTSKLLAETGILVTPGSAYGQCGEGFFRVSLSVPTVRVYEAAERIRSKIK